MCAVKLVLPGRPSVLIRALVRLLFVAAKWTLFVGWVYTVMHGDAIFEATKAAIWLGRAVGAYLGALAFWVIYNRMLAVLGAIPGALAGEGRSFETDHFGRPVAVASDADFRHQHLVLQYAEDQKVYRTPKLEDTGAEQEATAAAGLRALAAAAGVGFPQGSLSSTSKETGPEKYARDL